MAQRKTKAIVVTSPKEQTPRAPGPALLPLSLKHKYHILTHNMHTPIHFLKQVTRVSSVKNSKPPFTLQRSLVLQPMSLILLLFILNMDCVHNNFIAHSLKSSLCLSLTVRFKMFHIKCIGRLTVHICTKHQFLCISDRASL